MPQACSICKHARRPEIDQALLTGESLRDIAARTGTSRTSLSRHKLEHISAALVKAKQAKEAREAAVLAKVKRENEVKEEVQADSLLDQLKAIRKVTMEILKEARAAKQLPVALAAVNRIEKQLELEGKLLGELDGSDKGSGGVVINVLVRKSGYPSDWSQAEKEQVEMEVVTLPSRFVPRIAGGAPQRIEHESKS